MYTKETCIKKFREWEIKLGVLIGIKQNIERRIKAARNEQHKWREKWREAADHEERDE